MSFRDLFGEDDDGKRPPARPGAPRAGEPSSDEDFQLRAEDFAAQLLRAVQGEAEADAKPRGPRPPADAKPRAGTAPHAAAPHAIDGPPPVRPPAGGETPEPFDPLAELLGKDAPKSPAGKAGKSAKAGAKEPGKKARRRVRWKVVLPLVLTAVVGFGAAVLDNAGLLGSKGTTPAQPAPMAEAEKPAASTAPVLPPALVEKPAPAPMPAPVPTTTVPTIAHSGPAAPAGNPFAGRSTFALPAPPPAPPPAQTTTVPAAPAPGSMATAPATMAAEPPPATTPPAPAPAPAELQAQLAPPPAHGRGKATAGAKPEKAAAQNPAEPAPAAKSQAEPAAAAGKATGGATGEAAGGAAAAPERGRYTIQLGTFREAANAEKLARSLAAKGYGAEAADWTDGQGTTWKVVRVGAFASSEAASRQIPDLKNVAGLSGVVLRLR